MSSLIKALSIFLRYGDPAYPTACHQGCLVIHGIGRLSDEDETAVKDLGFFYSTGQWKSYRFGS